MEETLERAKGLFDLIKQGDVNVTMGGGEEVHHKAYQRRSKSGKPEQIKQKGAIPAKGEQLKKPEKGGKQEAGAVLGGEEHQGFKGMLDSYFNNQKEMRDLTTRINSLKVESEEVMKNIRPLLAKFENIDKAEDKYRVEFKEGDWDYKFLSFTRETKSFKELYTKAFNMLNDMQRAEMTKAEEALKQITAQEKFSREAIKALIDKYVGKIETEELMKSFEAEILELLNEDKLTLAVDGLVKALMAGGTPAGTSGTGVNKRSDEEDDEDKDKKKKKTTKKKKDPELEAKEKKDAELLLRDRKPDKKEDKEESKDTKDKKETPEDKEHEKFINKLEDEDVEENGKSEKDAADKPDKDGTGKTGTGDNGDAPKGKNGAAYTKLATSLENLLALRQRGVKLLKHMFERKDAHGAGEKRPKNEEAVKKDNEEQEEKKKSLIETTLPIVALRFAEVLEKSKKHKE